MASDYDVDMEIFDDPVKRARTRRREEAMAELRAALARKKKESPRHRAPDEATSVAGAKDVEKRALTQKDKLLQAFEWAGERGFTDEQAAYRAGLLGSCFWRRCTSLRQLGYIEQPEGKPVRKGSSGVSRIVCEITDAGRIHLANLK